MPATDLPIIVFSSAKSWEEWLAKNHANQAGVWLKLFKKASGKPSMDHGEALDVALCYGWIDGQSKGNDEESWLQKFTPRRPKSLWSKRNREHIDRLIKTGKMTPAGLKEVEAAKADGRWDQAYDSPKNMEIPADFLKVLAKNKPALKTFKKLNKTNLYAIAWRLQTAKRPETRERRLKAILETLSKGEKFY